MNTVFSPGPRPVRRAALPVLALGLLFCAACAPKQILAPAKPKVPAVAAASPSYQGFSGVSRHYLVRRGDNLWDIAARRSVLNDPFQWPLLFRLNRDQIQDPDLIYPRQDLVYRRVLDARLLAEIRREARDTPTYRHHIRPRKVLPIRY